MKMPLLLMSLDKEEEQQKFMAVHAVCALLQMRGGLFWLLPRQQPEGKARMRRGKREGKGGRRHVHRENWEQMKKNWRRPHICIHLY
jgi:hypothetical protein